jgi:hypothetical protein
MIYVVLYSSGVEVFFSRQDAGLLPAKPDSGNCLAFYCWRFKTFTRTRTDALEQEPTPCFAFLGGNSPLPIRSIGAIILS